MTGLSVSVIIPAHNAATTVGDTLRSLMDQTSGAWEAIVIDDGSTDETAAIAQTLAEREARIRVIQQTQSGVSAARNHGIRLAQYDWILFLDSDDWIASNYLEKMTAHLLREPELTGVYCGWVRVTSVGEFMCETRYHAPEPLFPKFARTCVFAVHACVIRKDAIQSVGGFDPRLRTCEDWDLWHRIARTGAKFAVEPDVLAYYCMTPTSASINGTQMLTDALQVMQRCYAPDARVPNPLDIYAQGQPQEEFPAAILEWSAWAAGLMIGSGGDPLSLLESVAHLSHPGLDPSVLAYSLLYAAMLPTCQPLAAWTQHWHDYEKPILQFLEQLELQSGTWALARRSRLMLEHLILQYAQSPLPQSMGSTYAIEIEITQPINDITIGNLCERLYTRITLDGNPLGDLLLPVCDGWVSQRVLVDAIAAQFSWEILKQFLQYHQYAQWLAPDLSAEETQRYLEDMHNRDGWLLFLQDIWHRPHWSNPEFYNPNLEETSTTVQHHGEGWFTLEISAELPHVEVNASELPVLITVGGVAIGSLLVLTHEHRVTSQALRFAVTDGAGYELCIASVREALIGRSLASPPSLRQRLAEAALNHHPDAWTTESIATMTRYPYAMGTSASRWVQLPLSTLPEFSIEAPAAPKALWYVPALISQITDLSTGMQGGSTHELGTKFSYDRHFFESLFANQPDPWKYTTPYEQTKYEQTLSLIPKRTLKRALELACAEGHFTVQLAPLVRHLVVADIAQIALERTAQRCAGFKHLEYQQINLAQDPLPGLFDLIICSEVLYYMGSHEDLKAIAQKMGNALEPGGYLIMAHAHVVADEPNQTGFDWDVPFGASTISQTFSAVPDLKLMQEIWTPLYRIQCFQKRPKLALNWSQKVTHYQRLEHQPTPLQPDVAMHVLWQGGEPRRHDAPPIQTRRLPILMYHRIAPTGADRMRRWRSTPEQFEEQLRYLQDAGYYSVSLEVWQQALATKQPLPGRAIILTFDDGYEDFYTYAAPLLKQYGFSAWVFLVADKIGQTNSWDHDYGEELPLMTWQQIHELQMQGIEFASHAATHRPLTALTPEEIVQETLRSRRILSEGLGHSIQAIAYPHGDTNTIVEHLLGGCGYIFGLTCRPGFSQFSDRLLALPRIEIMGTEYLEDFVAKLSTSV